MSKISSIFIEKRFVIETDHKPLETIFKKSFSKCPLRLQRLRITLQNYDIEVCYKPRKHLYHILLMLSHYKDCTINESDIQVQINLIRLSDGISPKRNHYYKNK